jgi:phage gpG-like protein
MGSPTIKQLQSSVRNGLQIETDFIPPLRLVAERIATLGAKVSSFEEPLHKAITEVVIPSILTNFDVGGRPPWEPLSEATHEISERLGKPARSVLIRTGSLRAAMGDVGSWDIGEDTAELTIPDKVWYGIVHQGGFEGKAGGSKIKGKSFKQIVHDPTLSAELPISPIPERPFAVLQPQDEAKIEDVFMEWLGEKIEEAYP